MNLPSDRALVLACGAHSLLFALFHLAFWRLFAWRRTLADATIANRAVIQILNVQLVFVFLAVAAACFVFADALVSTPLGRALLGAMSVFWILRLLQQAIFLRLNTPMVHVLSALFLLGAILFALPLIDGPL